MTGDTRALSAVRATGAAFREVRTQQASSADHSAELQDISPAQLLRSIVVRRGENDYLFVLVPADRDIDWRKLRHHLAVKRLSLPPGDDAEMATGYRPGTITPFGSTHAWPVLVDAAVTVHDIISIGGGAPGVNIQMAPMELARILNADVADVTGARRARTED